METRDSTMRDTFRIFAERAAALVGSYWAFLLAVLTIATWAITGPYVAFSDTWQLLINTGTTIVTFLMVFLIQNTQNRDAEAIQIKLDELLRSIDGAHLALLDLEELDEKDLDRIRNGYRKLARRARKDLAAGKSDTDVREVGPTHRDAVSREK
jgi:low affinity Fe/Cu permease